MRSAHLRNMPGNGHVATTLRRNVLLFGLVMVALPGCKIVRNGAAVKTDPQKPDSFDANAYVATLWKKKVQPFFQTGSHDIATVLAALVKDSDAADKQYGQAPAADGGAWTFAVKGTGTVTAVDAKSAHGTLTLTLPGVSSPVIIQVGPVVFGSAIRDCLSFFGYENFVNQIEYAEVSRALNTQAMDDIHHNLDLTKIMGKSVTFSGGMADPSMTGEIDITPVTLVVTA